MKIKKKIKKLFKLFNKCRKNKIVAVIVDELDETDGLEELKPISFTDSMRRRKLNEIIRHNSYPQLSSDSSE